MAKEQNNKEQKNKNIKPIKKEKRRNGSKIELSVPWTFNKLDVRIPLERVVNRFISSPRFDETKNDCYNNFIKERTHLHEIYIKEEAKNKRIRIILAFLLILLASAIVLFAPQGREKISYWIGAALVLFAAGASGFGRIWGKMKNISFGAAQDNKPFKDNK